VNRTFLLTALIVSATVTECFAAGRDYGWYTEGDYIPGTRIKVVLHNTLDFERSDCPVVITRDRIPIPNISDFWVTVVDPKGPPLPEPSAEDLAKVGGWLPRKETNGHFLRYQLDDIDKDGIWDELFFMVDIGGGETKTVYLYTEQPNRPFLRGLYKQDTFAMIGNYERNLITWWESKTLGWKLAYPTDVDMYAKREPMLVAYEEQINNYSGYNKPFEHGSDILMVSNTFGTGGICLFEESALPDSVSRPRFSPYQNMGQFYDTRYARHVIVSGPLRSIIRMHTMNWRTGKGTYELDQYYTAYKDKSYSTCSVAFHTFLPENPATEFGCGIRRIMNEYEAFQDGGTVISFGRDVVIESPSPDEKSDEKVRIVLDFEGIAMVVKDEYMPRYRALDGFGGNHVFRIPVNETKTFEYLIAGGWSEGSLNRTADEFKDYVLKAAQEFNNPPDILEMNIEKKR